MRETLRMQLNLYFMRVGGEYLPNHPMTASFLSLGLTGTESKTKLTDVEFEFLKTVRKNHGLILHVDIPGQPNAEVFD